MLVRASRIVRLLSASRPDTWRVTRPRKQIRRPRASGPTSSPAALATPVPPPELAVTAGEIGTLVEELAELTGSGDAWGVRVVRRNTELAQLSPETLESAMNQLDFIEE